MIHIRKKDFERMLQAELYKGISQGIKLMEEKMLLACENGNALDIRGKAYFIQSDIQNLRNIISDLEKGVKFALPMVENNKIE